MITVFEEYGNPFSQNIFIVEEIRGSFDPINAVCGGCGAKGLLIFYCTYTRWLNVLEGGTTVCKEILLDRHQCICGKTHVVAPGELVIPYFRHSFGFIIAVIEAYTKREKPVRSIAEDFQIAVSTLYAWVERFKDHYELLFGKLSAISGDLPTHLENLRQALPRRFFGFVCTYGICFLQTKPKVRETRCFVLRGHLIFHPGASP